MAHSWGMDIRRFPHSEAMSRFAADLTARAVAEAVAERGRCSLVLAGGSTPRRTHELLARTPGLAWEAVHVFLGDERCVPPHDPASNLTMARATLIDRVPLPPGNLHAMHCPDGPEQGAKRYAADLEAFFGGPPAFDVVMLGMGADGHTASLFPGHAALESAEWAVAVDGRDGRPPVDRVSLTLAALNRARLVVFLVSGAAKSALVEAMAADPEAAAGRWPAARVRAARLVWCVAP